MPDEQRIIPPVIPTRNAETRAILRQELKPLLDALARIEKTLAILSSKKSEK